MLFMIVTMFAIFMFMSKVKRITRATQEEHRRRSMEEHSPIITTPITEILLREDVINSTVYRPILEEIDIFANRHENPLMYVGA
jgi:hypothetical protein